MRLSQGHNSMSALRSILAGKWGQENEFYLPAPIFLPQCLSL